MSQAYSNPKRASDPYALPDVEVFCIDERGEWDGEPFMIDVPCEEPRQAEPGWYWWSCFPGCLPDGDPIGPFATEAEALADAQEGSDDGNE